MGRVRLWDGSTHGWCPAAPNSGPSWQTHGFIYGLCALPVTW
jgi:hypothetical protein